VLDVRLPGRAGLDLQHELTASNIKIPVIFITEHGDIPMSRPGDEGRCDRIPDQAVP
jgi:FixJ family two-component response regulator